MLSLMMRVVRRSLHSAPAWVLLGAGRSGRHGLLAALVTFALLLSTADGAGTGPASAGPAVQAGGGDATAVAGPPKLTATFNSIGIELPFSGDTNGNATARVEFRPAGDSGWRLGLPLWRTADPTGPAFYGSLLLLDAGTTYELHVTVTDGDGVSQGEQTASIATRADEIAPAESLAPSHYVRTEGDDGADGLSRATAWRTIDKAVSAAPAGAVVQVGPGFYPTSRAGIGRPNTARTTPLTLVAEYPAVAGDGVPANVGRRSVIEPVGVSSPAGATDGPNPGVWTSVTLTGPKTGASYTVWKWAGSPVADAAQLGFAASRTDLPTRVARWNKDEQDLATPDGWAEKLYTNLTYGYGFFADGPDIYLRLPGDRDPNTFYVTASGVNQVGLAVNGPDIRISGFEVRQFVSGVDALSRAQRLVVDHCLLTGNFGGVAFRGDRSPPNENGVPTTRYGSDNVVQDNVILDSSLRAADSNVPSDGSIIPWMFIKSKIREADGSDYATSKLGAQSETAAVTGRGGAQRVVVRRNTIDGTFNGVGPGYNLGFDRYAAQDMDIYDNVIRHIADDPLEPELAVINFRAWNNRFEETLTVLSIGPVYYGPVYLFRNIAIETGQEGVAGDGQGRMPGSTMIKYSGKSSPTARVFILHNTFWTDRPTDGGSQFASTGTAPEALYLRNNLIRTARYAFAAPDAAGSWDEDSNYFVTTDTTRGLSYNGGIYRGNVQAYRDAVGQGARTNMATGFVSDVALIDPRAGDVRPPPDSPLIDAGSLVPNLSDRQGIDYRGAAPDIGAIESQR